MLGGLSIVVFGLIAATAGRIWVENRVDFSNPRNLITVAVALVLGAGNFKLNVAGFTLDGIGTATFGAIILYHILQMAPDTERTRRARRTSFSAFQEHAFRARVEPQRGLRFASGFRLDPKSRRLFLRGMSA